jgi:hypothetical protein
MDTCSICLDELKDEHNIKILSCGHRLHFNCFKKIVYRNHNFYIKCPLCREHNINIDKPLNSNCKENIKLMLHQGIRTNKCVCKTKKGLQCKNKPIMLNYGMCRTHNKSILDKKYYRLYCDYIYHLFCLNYKFKSILYLLDLGKKIIIKYFNGNDDEQVHQIFEYYYRFLMTWDDDNGLYNMINIYEYYELDKPPQKWLNYCIDKNIII